MSVLPCAARLDKLLRDSAGTAHSAGSVFKTGRPAAHLASPAPIQSLQALQAIRSGPCILRCRHDVSVCTQDMAGGGNNFVVRHDATSSHYVGLVNPQFNNAVSFAAVLLMRHLVHA